MNAIYPAKSTTECWMLFDGCTWIQGFHQTEQSARYRRSEITPWYMDVYKVKVTIEPIAELAKEAGK